MDTNPLLHAQFPARESLGSLERYLAEYTAEQLRGDDDDAPSGVLVARDAETGAIAGFAKWDSPKHPERVKLESGAALQNLEGCRREFLDGYAARAEAAKERCFGERACYRMWLSTFTPFNQAVSLPGNQNAYRGSAGSGAPAGPGFLASGPARAAAAGVRRSAPLRSDLFTHPATPPPGPILRRLFMGSVG
jgi:hypothetical protein